MYVALDLFLILFHTGLILFNLAGWVWKRTRRLHLWSVGITMFSWLGMGWYYGWGYCLCTDWHWQVRRRLGDAELPHSYTAFLAEELTGWSPDPGLVDFWTVALFAAAVACSLWVNFRPRPMKRREGGE
ncbi:MAG: DUF2784 domain-containing protein [Balneolaceae bacterium]|nr:DUF2784 domain-containing protein [Balneolaceae bacterium]